MKKANKRKNHKQDGLQKKDKIKIKLNANKIIEEFMREKASGVPIEQLIKEDERHYRNNPPQQKVRCFIFFNKPFRVRITRQKIPLTEMKWMST